MAENQLKHILKCSLQAKWFESVPQDYVLKNETNPNEITNDLKLIETIFKHPNYAPSKTKLIANLKKSKSFHHFMLNYLLAYALDFFVYTSPKRYIWSFKKLLDEFLISFDCSHLTEQPYRYIVGKYMVSNFIALLSIKLKIDRKEIRDQLTNFFENHRKNSESIFMQVISK